MVLGRDEIVRRIQLGQLVTDLRSKGQIQQAGIDLTVGKVYELQGEGALDFDNSKRTLCEYVEVPPADGGWTLKPGVYHCAMNEWINIPLDLCGLLLPRSSALACGLTIHTALWDPGYRGRSFMHTVVQKKVVVYEGARLAQMIFLPVTGKAEAYGGAYLDEDVLTRGMRGKQEKLDDWEASKDR